MAQYKRKKGQKIVKVKKDYSFKGINYKSSLEKTMAILLDEAGIPFKYEPESYKIIDSFDFPFECFERQSNGKSDFRDRGNKKQIGMSYTPDFVGEGFLIETKGFANESFPLRWKLVKRWISKNYEPGELKIFKPQNKAECEQVITLIKSNKNDSIQEKGGNRKRKSNS